MMSAKHKARVRAAVAVLLAVPREPESNPPRPEGEILRQTIDGVICALFCDEHEARLYVRVWDADEDILAWVKPAYLDLEHVSPEELLLAALASSVQTTAPLAQRSQGDVDMQTKFYLDNGLAMASSTLLLRGPDAELRLGMRADNGGIEPYLRRVGADDTRECVTRHGDGHHTNASISEAARALAIEPQDLVARVRAAHPTIDWPEQPTDED